MIRKIIFWIMAWSTLTHGQSFTVDVDYQLQRQYKGPLVKHEVFTNAQDLAAYVAGGAESRVYEGQVVVLAEDEGAQAFVVENTDDGLMAREIGSGAAESVAYTNVVGRLWDLRKDQWGLGFDGIAATNSVWVDGKLYSLGDYVTAGKLRFGDSYIEGVSTSSHGELSRNRLAFAWAPEPWRYGEATIALVDYDLLTLKIDGDVNTMTELQNPRLLIHGGLHADTNHWATNIYGGELVVLGSSIMGAGAQRVDSGGVALGVGSVAGVGGFAAGAGAIGADGAFVFADGQENDFKRAAEVNSFSVRAQGGTYFETASFEVTGDVQMGSAFGTNVIAGDTQIGNAERRLDITQLGLTISDGVTEEVEFAVEQYAPSLWRVDLRGNPLINAGEVSAESVMLGGEGLTNWPATVLEANKGQWALDAYSPPEDFVVQTNGASITIKDYAGPGGMVRIPPYIDGLPVTVIFWNAFSADNEILHIVVPPTVTEIQERGIYECDNLISADLGGSITVVPNSLFARCYALEKVTGLDRVTNIEPFGFHSSGLKEVHFGSTVTNIGQFAFYNCPSLTAVYFEGDAPTILGPGVLSESLQATVYYRSGSGGFGETWPPGGYARPTAIFGPLPANGANVFGQTIEPDSRGILQIPGIVELVFTTGDRLQADGTNLFYVAADGVTTNALTANP